MTLTNPPYCLQASSHSAQLFREAVSSLINPAGGIIQSQDMTVTQNGTPNMSVNVGAGRCWVPGTSLSSVNPGGGAYLPQGLYFAENDATVNLSISASNPSNPRIDQIIVQIEDAAYAGAGNLAQFAVITGTPTSGASLGNLVGLGTFPPSNSSALLLAYVLVPASASTIITADISNVVAATKGGLAAQQDTGWVALGAALLGTAAGGYPTPSYRTIGDRVWLKGGVNTSGTGGIATLPSAIRPPSNTIVALAGEYSSSTLYATNGLITASSGAFYAGFSATYLVSLEGISYSLS